MIFCVGEIERNSFCFTWHCVHTKALDYIGKMRFLAPPPKKWFWHLFVQACRKRAKSLCSEPASFVVANGISIALTPPEFHFFLKEQLKHYSILWRDILKSCEGTSQGHYLVEHKGMTIPCVCVFCLVSSQCFVFWNVSCLFLVIPGGYLADITRKKGN